ncbi:unnamed protein product [[Candida] boidinii]|uniref:Structure-specific endonuclease subunit SLX4 n=1 Tax=Candida boidinii TaxID=5477 RepID=A0A9W6STD5_CANBO|nr:hypothetical protein B5S30_g1829 [[Candida] boidinii]GME66552.1 unnamed protein product [[Candida] boidinii]
MSEKTGGEEENADEVNFNPPLSHQAQPSRTIPFDTDLSHFDNYTDIVPNSDFAIPQPSTLSLFKDAQFQGNDITCERDEQNSNGNSESSFTYYFGTQAQANIDEWEKLESDNKTLRSSISHLKSFQFLSAGSNSDSNLQDKDKLNNRDDLKTEKNKENLIGMTKRKSTLKKSNVKRKSQTDAAKDKSETRKQRESTKKKSTKGSRIKSITSQVSKKYGSNSKLNSNQIPILLALSGKKNKVNEVINKLIKIEDESKRKNNFDSGIEITRNDTDGKDIQSNDLTLVYNKNEWKIVLSEINKRFPKLSKRTKRSLEFIDSKYQKQVEKIGNTKQNSTNYSDAGIYDIDDKSNNKMKKSLWEDSASVPLTFTKEELAILYGFEANSGASRENTPTLIEDNDEENNNNDEHNNNKENIDESQFDIEKSFFISSDEEDNTSQDDNLNDDRECDNNDVLGNELRYSLTLSMLLDSGDNKTKRSDESYQFVASPDKEVGHFEDITSGQFTQIEEEDKFDEDEEEEGVLTHAEDSDQELIDAIVLQDEPFKAPNPLTSEGFGKESFNVNKEFRSDNLRTKNVLSTQLNLCSLSEIGNAVESQSRSQMQMHTQTQTETQSQSQTQTQTQTQTQLGTQFPSAAQPQVASDSHVPERLLYPGSFGIPKLVREKKSEPIESKLKDRNIISDIDKIQVLESIIEPPSAQLTSFKLGSEYNKPIKAHCGCSGIEDIGQKDEVDADQGYVIRITSSETLTNYQPLEKRVPNPITDDVNDNDVKDMNDVIGNKDEREGVDNKSNENGDEEEDEDEEFKIIAISSSQSNDILHETNEILVRTPNKKRRASSIYESALLNSAHNSDKKKKIQPVEREVQEDNYTFDENNKDKNFAIRKLKFSQSYKNDSVDHNHQDEDIEVIEIESDHEFDDDDLSVEVLIDRVNSVSNSIDNNKTKITKYDSEEDNENRTDESEQSVIEIPNSQDDEDIFFYRMTQMEDNKQEKVEYNDTNHVILVSSSQKECEQDDSSDKDDEFENGINIISIDKKFNNDIFRNVDDDSDYENNDDIYLSAKEYNSYQVPNSYQSSKKYSKDQESAIKELEKVEKVKHDHIDSSTTIDFNKFSVKELRQQMSEWGLKPVKGKENMIKSLQRTIKLIDKDLISQSVNDKGENFILFSQPKIDEDISNIESAKATGNLNNNVKTEIFKKIRNIVVNDKKLFNKVITYKAIALNKFKKILNLDKSIDINIEILIEFLDYYGIVYVNGDDGKDGEDGEDGEDGIDYDQGEEEEDGGIAVDGVDVTEATQISQFTQ